MPRSNSRSKVPEGLERGTYFVPGLGLVENGELLDGDDVEAVQAYHDRDAKNAEQSVEAIQERDAAIVEAVRADEPADDSDKE